MPKIMAFPKRRKHTLCFLNHARTNTPVTLSTEIDMSEIIAYRTAHLQPQKLSYISFLMAIIAQTLEDYPQANAFYKPGLFPKIVQFQGIHAKLTFDYSFEKTRVVLSAVIQNANQASLLDIQTAVDTYKQADPLHAPIFAGIRRLHQLPLFLGKFLFKKMMFSPQKSAILQGSFSLTSLGHQPIDLFIPFSGANLSFGVGQIKERASVEGGSLVVKPILILTLVFDHRLIDGAYAAEFLTDIKKRLESFHLFYRRT